jgi:hypothetical protein
MLMFSSCCPCRTRSSGRPSTSTASAAVVQTAEQPGAAHPASTARSIPFTAAPVVAFSVERLPAPLWLTDYNHGSPDALLLALLRAAPSAALRARLAAALAACGAPALPAAAPVALGLAVHAIPDALWRNTAWREGRDGSGPALNLYFHGFLWPQGAADGAELLQARVPVGLWGASGALQPLPPALQRHSGVCPPPPPAGDALRAAEMHAHVPLRARAAEGTVSGPAAALRAAQPGLPEAEVLARARAQAAAAFVAAGGMAQEDADALVLSCELDEEEAAAAAAAGRAAGVLFGEAWGGCVGVGGQGAGAGLAVCVDSRGGSASARACVVQVVLVAAEEAGAARAALAPWAAAQGGGSADVRAALAALAAACPLTAAVLQAQPGGGLLAHVQPLD